MILADVELRLGNRGQSEVCFHLVIIPGGLLEILSSMSSDDRQLRFGQFIFNACASENLRSCYQSAHWWTEKALAQVDQLREKTYFFGMVKRFEEIDSNRLAHISSLHGRKDTDLGPLNWEMGY